MVEELQLSLARWRAGEWKFGRRSGRCDRIFGRSSGLPHTVALAVGAARRARLRAVAPVDARENEKADAISKKLTHSLSLTHSLTHSDSLTHSLTRGSPEEGGEKR